MKYLILFALVIQGWAHPRGRYEKEEPPRPGGRHGGPPPLLGGPPSPLGGRPGGPPSPLSGRPGGPPSPLGSRPGGPPSPLGGRPGGPPSPLGGRPGGPPVAGPEGPHRPEHGVRPGGSPSPAASHAPNGDRPSGSSAPPLPGTAFPSPYSQPAFNFTGRPPFDNSTNPSPLNPINSTGAPSHLVLRRDTYEHNRFIRAVGDGRTPKPKPAKAGSPPPPRPDENVSHPANGGLVPIGSNKPNKPNKGGDKPRPRRDINNNKGPGALPSRAPPAGGAPPNSNDQSRPPKPVNSSNGILPAEQRPNGNRGPPQGKKP